MSGRKPFCTLAALSALAVVAAACSGGGSTGSSPTAAPSSAASNAASPPGSTKLIIEITGGFAYVPDIANRTLEVAYLNDVELKRGNRVVCRVDEIGTHLTVLRGKIVGNAPPNRTFNLDGTDLKIPALDNTTTPLTATRTSATTVPPPPTGATWKNLQFVRSLKDFHPNVTLRPKWRDEVNGRLIVKGGNLVATAPTDPGIEIGDFEFKQGALSRGNFALSDRTVYTVDVPGNAVELVFEHSPKNYGTVRIEPNATGQPVRLKLFGLHAPNAVSSFAKGQEVTDYCGFYSLINEEIPESDMVKVFYNGPSGTFPLGAQPSPGYFCGGDWFP